MGLSPQCQSAPWREGSAHASRGGRWRVAKTGPSAALAWI